MASVHSIGCPSPGLSDAESRSSFGTRRVRRLRVAPSAALPAAPIPRPAAAGFAAAPMCLNTMACEADISRDAPTCCHGPSVLHSMQPEQVPLCLIKPYSSTQRQIAAHALPRHRSARPHNKSPPPAPRMLIRQRSDHQRLALAARPAVSLSQQEPAVVPERLLQLQQLQRLKAPAGHGTIGGAPHLCIERLLLASSALKPGLNSIPATRLRLLSAEEVPTCGVLCTDCAGGGVI